MPASASEMRSDATSPVRLSRRAYARMRGFSHTHLLNLIAKGIVPIADGKVDPVAADRALAAETGDPGRTFVRRANEARRGNGNTAGGNDKPDDASAAAWADERRREARANADLKEMEVARQRGTLCVVDDVHRAIADTQDITRRMVRSIPDRIAARVAAELGIDPRRMHALMADEIEAVCSTLADAAAALPAARGARQ